MNRPTSVISRGASWILIGMVRMYQACLSPYLGRHCKYVPTCSHYFIQAVQWHGPLRGSWLGIKRICRCHPFSRGGYDPVDDPTDTPSRPT